MTAAPFLARVIPDFAPSVTGVQSYLSEGMGTIEGCVVVAVRCQFAGSTDQGWGQSWGCADAAGNTRVAWSWAADNATAGAAKTAGLKGGPLVRLVDPSTGSIVVEGDLSQFVDDGVEIDWITADSTDWRIFVILFSGSQCSCYAGNGGTGSTVSAGFQPDFVLTHPQPNITGTDVAQSNFGPGISTRVSNKNSSYQMLSADGVAVPEGLTIKDATAVLNVVTLVPGPNLSGANALINTYTSTGFNIATTGPGSGPGICFLAVKIQGARTIGIYHEAGLDSPAATGNASYTAPGHKTRFLYAGFGNNTAEGSRAGAAGGVGATDFINSACISVTSASGGTVTNTSSLFGNSLTLCLGMSQALQYSSDFISRDPSGFTLNWQMAAAAAKRWTYLSIEEPPEVVIPTGIASTEAFGTPVVRPGTVTLHPTGIASAQAFGTATIKATAKLLPTGIASAQAFGTPTLIAGVVTLSPTGIASAQAFGTATLIAGTVTLSPSSIASGESFGTLTILPGALTISPAGIASAEAFGTPELFRAEFIGVFGIPSEEVIGSLSLIAGEVLLLPSGIVSAEAFGLAELVAGVVTVAPSGIVSAEAFGLAELFGGEATILAQGIASGEAFGMPLVLMQGQQIIYPGSIASGEDWGRPFLVGGAIPVTLKKKVHDALIAAVQQGTFIAAAYDPETFELLQGSQVQAASIEANETETAYAVETRYGRKYVEDTKQWQWLVIVRFHQEVIAEPFLRALAENPICIKRDAEENRQVHVVLLEAKYEHPPRGNPSNGSSIRLRFNADLSPR